jgi:PAS domain S-box-containing protein
VENQDPLAPYFDGDPVLFRRFLDTAPDAMIVVNEEGRILGANQQVKNVFGYPLQELTGRPVEILVPARFRDLHPQHRSGYFKNPRVRPMGADLNLFGLRADGSEFPVEISLSPMETQKGTLVTAAVRDVSDRRRQEQMLRDLLESAPDSMVIVDNSGQIQLVNSQTERLFGHPRADILGKTVEALIPERFRDMHVKHRDRFFAQPSIRPMGLGLDLYGLHANGSEFPVEISLSPIQTRDGVLVAAAVRDITDRQRGEERLRRSLAEKEVLLKEIHHRVKNNLQVIASLLNLQQSTGTKRDTSSMLQESRNRIKTMALVHESLYQSRDLAAIDTHDYLQRLVRDLFMSYSPEGPKIDLKVDVEAVRVPIDTAVQCGLLLNELLSNALKHAFADRKSGTVEVSFKHEEDDLVLLVRDDGVGLPEGLDRESPETLGLRLVHTITEQLGGRVELKPGDGTLCRVVFPAKKHLQEDLQ